MLILRQKEQLKHQTNKDKELAEKSFYQFVKQAWQWIDPNPFQDGWHVKFLCDHIQAFEENLIENLGINIPPGYAKSLISSVLYPAWVWTIKPDIRFLTGSNAIDLAVRDCRKARMLLASEWYAKNWGHLWGFKSDENTKSSYENDKGGFRNVFSINGHVTGFRGDRRIIDDPHDASDSHNEESLKKDCEWFDTVFSTRSDPLKPSKTLLIMQRLSVNDLTGHILSKNDKSWTLVCLPLEYEPDRKCKTIIGEDPRTIKGEYIWGNKTPVDRIISLKKALGISGVAGQLQQRPTLEEGQIFKRELWKYYTKETAPEFDYIVMSLDSAWEIAAENDYSVCTVWGICNSNVYLIEMWREKVTYIHLKVAIQSLAAKYNPSLIYVEDAASGKAIKHELLQTTNLPIFPVKPLGKKEVRAHAVTPMIEQGRVFLLETMPNLYDFMTEISNFPKDKHDDIVDSVTQALNQLFVCGLSSLTFF